MNRRKFVKNKALIMGGLMMSPTHAFLSSSNDVNISFTTNRPPFGERTFVSESVEALISKIKVSIADNELAWLFENCYPNTLDTTVDYEVIGGKADTFIITGDIDAMWLRDSTAQVWPYLPLIKEDNKLKDLVKGLINRQIKCVLKDPYANAFYKDLEKESHWKSDIPAPIPGVHERKWEIDSLCYVVRLSNEYLKLTGDITVLDEDWNKAMHLIVSTFRTEQQKDGKSPYSFVRKTTAMIDAPVFNGTGRPMKPVGLIASMFRPSDDATLYPFLIPSNIFAYLSLIQLGKIYQKHFQDQAFVKECEGFAKELGDAIRKYAIAEHMSFGPVYAYEVDGFGNRLFMDDANVPSLMSLAYLDKSFAAYPIYQHTRNFLLSEYNPYFLKGSAAEGQASPHTGKEKIWPMGIILRAMTASDEKEIIHCLKMLKNTHAGTGFMHEAFHKDDPTDYNRSWFAWANTLFGELIIKIYNEKPGILSGEL
jgi:hypothetical protein